MFRGAVPFHGTRRFFCFFFWGYAKKRKRLKLVRTVTLMPLRENVTKKGVRDDTMPIRIRHRVNFLMSINYKGNLTTTSVPAFSFD